MNAACRDGFGLCLGLRRCCIFHLHAQSELFHHVIHFSAFIPVVEHIIEIDGRSREQHEACKELDACPKTEDRNENPCPLRQCSRVWQSRDGSRRPHGFSLSKEEQCQENRNDCLDTEEAKPCQ